jgi:HEPN domain-containing protein
MRRTKDWLAQAEKDISAAENSVQTADYEWACFQAQQGAEKAAKAALQSKGRDVRGHSVYFLLKNLSELEKISEDLLIEARNLDRHYISSRYPDSYDVGTPADYYDKRQAENSINSAKDVLKRAKAIIG